MTEEQKVDLVEQEAMASEEQLINNDSEKSFLPDTEQFLICT